MYQGAVFFDMDGTLVDGKNGVVTPTQKTCEAIKWLKENNFLVGLATGRGKSYVDPEAMIFDCYITSNGAHAEASGINICDRFIEPADLRQVMEYLDKKGINFVVEGQEVCYVRDVNEHYFRQMLDNFHWSDHSFLQLEGEVCIPVNKLMVSYDNMEKLNQFMSDYGDIYDITEQPGNQASDVGMKGISKGYGVKKVIDYFGLDLSKTYAFGDADNDYVMLSVVGNGIAMGRHTKGLEEVCCYITDTVKNDGIEKALKHFNLI